MKTQERWLVISNCQTHGLANSLQALAPDVEVTALYPHTFNRAPLRHNHQMAKFDRLFISSGIEAAIPRARLDRITHHIAMPTFGFRAFHPDLVYVSHFGKVLKSPADDYHSGIALAAWRKGMNLADARTLFNAKVFEACGLFGWWRAERDRMVAHSAALGLDIEREIRRWGRHEAFMYSINHPRVRVLFDIAAQLVRKTGREPLAGATMPHDNLAFAGCFAVYPEIGESLGVPGCYLFKTYDTYRHFGLDEFLQRSFEIYDRFGRDDLVVTDEFKASFAFTESAL